MTSEKKRRNLGPHKMAYVSPCSTRERYFELFNISARLDIPVENRHNL